ncbi:unnamed protein product, partial [Rotaria socialis]
MGSGASCLKNERSANVMDDIERFCLQGDNSFVLLYIGHSLLTRTDLDRGDFPTDCRRDQSGSSPNRGTVFLHLRCYQTDFNKFGIIGKRNSFTFGHSLLALIFLDLCCYRTDFNKFSIIGKVLKSTADEVEKFENRWLSSENEADVLGVKYNKEPLQGSVHDDKNSGAEYVAQNSTDKLKSFICNDCGLTFKRKENLRRHMLSVHEKLKPHKCPHCEYASSVKGPLSQHIKAVHEKLKPHKCSHCEYACSQKGDLSKHIKSVHVKLKPYRCPHCEYASSRK